MAGGSNIRHLTIYMLKESVQSHADALRNEHGLTRYGLRGDLPFHGALYIRTPPRKVPTWIEFVKTGTAGRIKQISLRSASAILFLESGRRLFAVTFGFGRVLLKPGTYETDFGLRVALNTVDPERLRSVDLQRVEELTIHTTRQTSRISPLETFGLDVSRDLLRGVTGQPRDEGFALRVTGSDSLVLDTRIEFSGLARKCANALKAYGERRYKDRFGWIDNLAAVRDPSLVGWLDEELLNALKRRQTGQMHLAAPEQLRWETVQGFYYPKERQDQQAHPDLEIDDFLNSVDDLDAVSLENLKDWRIRVLISDQDEVYNRWSVYESLVFEARHGGSVYVLSGGLWFQVAKSLADEVRDFITRLPQPNLGLPPCGAGESEEDYNERVARVASFALMDQELVTVGGASGSIEVCDLFSRGRQFIHVKKKTRSATLSHLFAQGIVSGDLFFRDEGFRREARRILTVKRRGWATLIPTERPRPSRYEVVFAVIARIRTTWPHALPFFSQLHLMQASRQLQGIGYQVGTCHIDER